MPIADLISLRERALNCFDCPLGNQCTNVVFGVGFTAAPPIAFVGEAPGEQEDFDGEPFVGRAGRLLTKFIEWMGYTRNDVYICNTVLCRPPSNRKPLPNELAACSGFLREQLAQVRPRVIVALGATAGQVLTGSTQGVENLRGSWWKWEGIPLRVTFHPSYLLRVPARRADAYADLNAVLIRLSESVQT